MGVPINKIDVARFKAITDLFLACNVGEVKLYISRDKTTNSSYVSIELVGNLPSREVENIFKESFFK